MVERMQIPTELIDALCGRRCAFAMYRLPGEKPVFCMATDGRTESSPRGESGFVISTFEGESRFIPGEADYPVDAARFEQLPPATPSTPPMTRDEYAGLFRRFKAPLLGNPPLLSKLVLARTADIAVPALSPAEAFRKACDLFDNTLTALFHTPQQGTWLFSTPELLLEGTGQCWHTMALAGTRLISESAWDDKNIREQRIVADFIRDTVGRHADSLVEEPTDNLQTGAIEHLCTRFHFNMEPRHLTALLQELPPTPAVCGYPPIAARSFLHTSPDIRRSCYAGYFGPMSPHRSSLYVALRGMRLYPGVCRLYAGGGIMPDSEEENEWRETEQKMQAMRRVIDACHP